MPRPAVFNPPASGGGGSLYPPNLTQADAALAADVAMTSANTAYDGPSIALAAGTWLVTGKVTVSSPGTNIGARLTDGTTIYDESETGCVANIATTMPLARVLVLGAGATLKVQGIAGTAAATLKANPTSNSGATNNATHISAVRLA